MTFNISLWIWKHWSRFRLWWHWRGKDRCPVCDGQGEVDDGSTEGCASIIWCDACDGRGYV